MKNKPYNFQRLKDYCLWYYFRYFPSNKRLENKLLEKSNWDKELVNKVISEIKHLLEEENIIRSKIKNYLFRNKNLKYIKQKLYEKLFQKVFIEEILQNEYIEEGKSLLSENFVERKILFYKNKGKSRNYISNKLIERKEDIQIVEKALENVFIDWDKENLEIEYLKIKNSFKEQKVIEKLLRKWFIYNDIKEVIVH